MWYKSALGYSLISQVDKERAGLFSRQEQYFRGVTRLVIIVAVVVDS